MKAPERASNETAHPKADILEKVEAARQRGDALLQGAILALDPPLRVVVAVQVDVFAVRRQRLAARQKRGLRRRRERCVWRLWQRRRHVRMICLGMQRSRP